MSTPPPKHLIENEHIVLWYRAQRTIFVNCARRPPVLPRHLSLVYVEPRDVGVKAV